MITVRFQIAGRAEDVEVPVVPRKDEIVKIWEGSWTVIEVIHDYSENEIVIWVSLYPYNI